MNEAAGLFDPVSHSGVGVVPLEPFKGLVGRAGGADFLDKHRRIETSVMPGGEVPNDALP